MKRNPAIELYRCLMMFGICLLHAVSQGAYGNVYLGRLLCSCVVGFVVISGWYGIKFRPSKAVRLVATAVWCAIVSSSLFGVSSHWLSTLKSYWFVWAYLFLMLFSPLVDVLVKELGENKIWRRTVGTPIFVCVFVWGTLACNHFTIKFVPADPGLASYSGVTLLGIYVVVRVLRQGGWLQRCSRFILGICAAGASLFVLVGVSQYNSPFALGLVVAVFGLFISLRLPDWRWLRLMAPSVFAVYLYHTGPFFALIPKLEKWAVCQFGLPITISWAGVAVLVFVGAGLLDVPRRLLVGILGWPIHAVLDKIDAAYASWLNAATDDVER